MDEYLSFLTTKRPTAQALGFARAEADTCHLPPALFDWQRQLVRWALVRGRPALFCDTGLGKTAMQLAWLDAILTSRSGRGLILAPLAVTGQTVEEAAHFGISGVKVCREPEDVDPDTRIVVTNYDRLGKFDPTEFVAVVLDESSILKNLTGTTRNLLIETFRETPFRLCCTATPSPNDHVELGNHAEFLGVLPMTQMLARYFINDLGDTGTWRLKGYAEADFWAWVATWAVAIRTPADLLDASGQPYDDAGYVLPALEIEHITVSVDHNDRQEETGELFANAALSATTMHREMRRTAQDRAKALVALVQSEPDEPWLLWCHTAYEAEAIRALMPSVTEVQGSDTPEQKESRLLGFAHGTVHHLLTKPSIAGFGLNYQHCARMAFVGLSYSYESMYQAIRRCWRYGQQREVKAWLIAAESEGGVRSALLAKETQHREMQRKMIDAMRATQGTMETETTIPKGPMATMTGDGWALHHGDCVDVWRALPDNSVDFTIYSPPFANLYVYSDDHRDMGNCADDGEFFRQFGYLLPELYRTTRSGRLMAVHCSQLPRFKWKDGMTGLRDFRGDIIRAAEAAGWGYHSEVCIWKNPVTEMQRTKSHGLLYKTIRTDATGSRVGMPDYLVVFRKDRAADESLHQPVTHNPEEFTLDLWQKVASPVWMDIDQGRVLNVRLARDGQDEKHLCPLQLDVIERAITLWSNPGDVVGSPFAGVGSEGVSALRLGRKFVGAELKESYARQAAKFLADATAQYTLLGVEA